ncbi:MAG: 2-oxoglutarate dehydrogenase complex dihydrolipoyllysine-residue succinyltransferase [Pseudomonadaceae bacterium]|nr:2-oxoglutarate dehydrogenase complex dihydrolipoyllysine-residue succinyltransferase [Pseudomonadaceae bacterium]
MTIEIKAPAFPESIADGEVATWLVAEGDSVKRDDVLVEVETDKVALEVPAPTDGVVTKILKAEGDTVLSEEALATFEAQDVADDSTAIAAADDSPGTETRAEASTDVPISPAARKLAEEQGVDLATVSGSGRGGRITKEDVVRAAAEPASKPVADAKIAADTKSAPSGSSEPAMPNALPGERVERRVPMTRLRASIAKRLVEAQQNAAMLTTFNEVNMQPIKDLRSKYQDEFVKAHNGTRLGYMSFFLKASVEALKRFPAVNASIDGNEIVYHGYYDIGVAVGTERGLVVPVVRDADALGLHQIEDTIGDFGAKARDGKLSIEDMTGGTFTISNGGVFGSMLSTPILNPPQTAILGMHNIQDRVMVENGEMVIRPMMYLALSYDHRLIDGSEAVRFLVTIKNLLEEPARILLEL